MQMCRNSGAGPLRFAILQRRNVTNENSRLRKYRTTHHNKTKQKPSASARRFARIITFIVPVRKEKLAILSVLVGGAKREVGRVGVGACDSRYIQTPDPYLHRLSDKSGHTRSRSNVDVCQRLLADQWQ